MDWLKTMPIVSLLLAVAFAAGSFVIDPARNWGDRYDRAVAEAREILVRNPKLVVDADGERVLEPEWLAELRLAAEESQAGAEVELPARMVARSQDQLDGLLSQAYEARRLAEPAWRLGVLDGESPPRNYWAHAFVPQSLAGLILMIAVLLVVAAPLERSWGSLLFGAFVALSIPLSAQGYRLLDASSGVPWSGSSGLAAALVGAYFIRGLGGHFVIPSFVILPVWLGVEAFVVRGFWLDDLASVPWATLCGSIAMGASWAALVRLFGIEKKLDAHSAKRAQNAPNPVVARAARLRSDGDPNQAFDLIQAAWRENRGRTRRSPRSSTRLRCELGQPEAAAEAILPVLRSALKKGQVDRALGYWLPLATRRCEVRLEPTAAVRLGEALLDAGHPDEALFSLRSAIDAGASTAHAVRILNIARDLDPGLTRRAAGIALADPALDAAMRARLEPLAALADESREAASPPHLALGKLRGAARVERAVDAEFQASERTLFPGAPDAETDSPLYAGSDAGDHQAQLEGQSLVAGALSEESLTREISDGSSMQDLSEAGSSDVLSHWNDKSALLAGELTRADDDESAAAAAEDLLSGDLLESRGDLFGDDDIDFFEADDETSDSDRTPLLDASDELTSPMAAAAAAAAALDSDCEATMMMSAAPATVVRPVASVVTAAPATDRRGSALLRALRAIDAVPLEVRDGVIEIDTDGRGKSRLPITRIEAIGMAAVRGLGPRPVLIVDCVLNWRDDIASPLKLIRFRSDRFDAAGLVAEQPGMTPITGLVAFACQLQRASGAACLPSEAILAGSPMSFDSLEDYERDVLGAERELAG